jgi:hypothetical protein
MVKKYRPHSKKSVEEVNSREAENREAAPAAIAVDSQTVKTTETGGPRGFDPAKKIKGRKRRGAVDTLGLPIECQIMPADIQDRDTPAPLSLCHSKAVFAPV